MATKHRIRSEHRKIYGQDLINSLFTHPYTKIQSIEREHAPLTEAGFDRLDGRSRQRYALRDDTSDIARAG